MIEPYLRRFDWLVLKPVWLGLIGLACALLIRAHWLAGFAILVLALLGVGAIGASLHRERSLGGLSAGYPSRLRLAERLTSAIDHETSYRIASAVMKLGLVLAAAAVVLAIHFTLRWYFVVLLGGLVAWLGPVLLMLPLAALLRRIGPGPGNK